jgi:hypothetical protein
MGWGIASIDDRPACTARTSHLSIDTNRPTNQPTPTPIPPQPHHTKTKKKNRMYEATREQKYLDIAEDLYGGCCTSSWSYSWDSKGACVHGWLESVGWLGLHDMVWVVGRGFVGASVRIPSG